MTRLPNTISIIWSYEDVKGYDIDERNCEKPLTDHEYREILQNVKRHHDCNLGVTWDSIASEIISYRQDKGEL